MRYTADIRQLFGNMFPFLVPLSSQWRPAPRLAAGDKARRRYGQSKYMPHQNVREKTRRMRQYEEGQLNMAFDWSEAKRVTMPNLRRSA